MQNDPINYTDVSYNGPFAGAACFSLLPIAGATLPSIGYDAAGTAFDAIFGSDKNSNSSSEATGSENGRCNNDGTSVKYKVSRDAVQTAVLHHLRGRSIFLRKQVNI